MTFQVADVSRPLTAVGQVCDKGNYVIFGPKGGIIVNRDSQAQTRFQRHNGIYELDLWIENEDSSGRSTSFPRRGDK